MELDAVDPQFAVANGHHLVLAAGSGNLELARHARRRERVVAAGFELLRKTGEDAAAVVADRARLAVDEPLRRSDLAAEGLDDCLVPEADAERRHARSEPPDDLDGRAGLARSAGSRRDDDVTRDQVRSHVRVDRVVPYHLYLAAERPEQVGEVVRERVVIVDQENHRRASASSI